MNESHFENLIKAYKKVHMTPEEKREVFKQSMLVIEKIEAVSLAHSDRTDELRLMDEQALGTEAAFSYGAIQKSKRTFIMNWVSYIKRREFLPAMVAAFLLLFTGGASLMAEQALPGDSLYSFKLNVNESVRGLAAVSDQANAEFAVDMSERRLQEAVLLSSQGKLTEDNKKILQDQFIKSSDQVRNQVASMVAKNNLTAAEKIAVNYEGKLKAHELVLENLSIATGENVEITSETDPTLATVTTSDTPVDPAATTLAVSDPAPTTKRVIPAPEVTSLLVTVKSQLDSTTKNRIDIQDKVFATAATNPSPSSTPQTSNNLSPQALIESNIKELKFTIADIQNQLKSYSYSAATVELVNRRINQANITIEKILSLVKSNQMIEASASSRTALQNLTEVEIVLKLEKNSKPGADGKYNFSSIFEGVVVNGDIPTTTPTTTPTVTN